MHSKYIEQGVAHEAGYDSFLTAEVAIRLSNKLCLSRENREKNSAARDEETPTVDTSRAGAALNLMDTAVPPRRGPSYPDGPRSESSDSTSGGGVPLDDRTNMQDDVLNEKETILETKKRRKRKRKPRHLRQQSMFSHAGMFDTLLEIEADDGASQGEEQEQVGDLDCTTHLKTAKPLLNLSMMPPFDNDFWKVYGNKLRVYGTQEGLCDLNPPSDSV